jgi:hypothetical protein
MASNAGITRITGTTTVTGTAAGKPPAIRLLKRSAAKGILSPPISCLRLAAGALTKKLRNRETRPVRIYWRQWFWQTESVTP